MVVKTMLSSAPRPLHPCYVPPFDLCLGNCCLRNDGCTHTQSCIMQVVLHNILAWASHTHSTQYTHNTYVSTHTTHAHTQHAYTLTHTHNTYVHTHTTHAHTHRHTHTHYISRAKQVDSLSEIARICMYHRTLMTHTPHLWCSTPVKSNLSGYHYLMATYIW